MARRLLAHLRRAGVAYAVLLGSLLLSLLAWLYVREDVEAQSRARFDGTVRATEAAIDRRTDAYLDAMFGARALFGASESVERGEWEGYVRGVDPAERFEGLQALGYAEKVTPSARGDFERLAREDGQPPLRPDLEPGGERDAYFPLVFVGPPDEANRDALNRDAYADPAHAGAMDEARDTGDPVATAPTYVLTSAAPGSTADLALQRGFAVYLPVYGGRWSESAGEPEGLARRREALRGFVVGYFKVAGLSASGSAAPAPQDGAGGGETEVRGLLDGVFGSNFDPGIDFEVYDAGFVDGPEDGPEGAAEDGADGGAEDGAGTLLYDDDGVQRAGVPGYDPLFSDESRIRVAGREWRLFFSTLSRFEEAAASSLPLFVLANGIGVSFALFAVTYLLVRSRVRAERAGRRLGDANRELEGTNRELEAFSYSVSHDLRAPLRTIDGFSQILLEDYADDLDDEGRDYLGRVRAASQHMGTLIDDLLDLSRVGRRPLRREPVDLSAVAREVSRKLKESQPERDVEFVVQPGVTAFGDESLLRVALENLLGNAFKFTGKKPRARVEFGADRNPPPGFLAPVYYVRDDGAGFDVAYADKLFGAFQRLHGASEFEGTGIGLATVQRIVHRHGGRVWAEGAVDAGATFFFTLGGQDAPVPEGAPKKAELA